jgi:hypothetical protein
MRAACLLLAFAAPVHAQSAEAAGKTISGGVGANGDGKSRSTASVDGKPVVNPLQQAMERGICKIGG